MVQQSTFEKYYLTLVEFLLLSKRNIIDIGERYSLTPMQSMSLVLLGQPRPMNSFTKIFNCDASNVTGIIDGLEKKDLASRFQNPADRRVKMVQLEPVGRKIRAQIITKLTDDKSYILKKLNPKEVDSFIKLLTKIIEP